MVLNTTKLVLEGVHFIVVRLPEYDRRLKEYRRLEPRLDSEVDRTLIDEIRKGQMDEIPSTGGWIKARVPSPSRNIGKSGGFRLIFLFLRVAGHIFLYTIFDHRAKADLSPAERSALKGMAASLKRDLKAREQA